MTYVTVNKDGEAYRSGIVTPDGTKLVKLTKNHFVLYIPGHKYWADRMTGQAYAAAEYEVYTLDHSSEHPPVERFENGSMKLRGTVAVYFPVRAPKEPILPVQPKAKDIPT